MTTEERFQDAAKRSKNLPNQSNDNLLKLYSLFKQASIGDVSGPKPGGFDFKGKAKYDAWTKLEGMTREDAMNGYANLVDELGS